MSHLHLALLDALLYDSTSHPVWQIDLLRVCVKISFFLSDKRISVPFSVVNFVQKS